MADQLIQDTVESLQKVNASIEDLRARISLLNDAKEDVTALNQTLRTLERRRDNWTTALEMRGVTVPKS